MRKKRAVLEDQPFHIRFFCVNKKIIYIFPIVGRYTNTDTTAKTIRVDVYNNTDSDTVNIQSNSSTWLKITEIGR